MKTQHSEFVAYNVTLPDGPSETIDFRTSKESSDLFQAAAPGTELYAFQYVDPNDLHIEICVSPEEVQRQYQIISGAGWNLNFYDEDGQWQADLDSAAAAFVADPNKEQYVERDYDQITFRKIVK